MGSPALGDTLTAQKNVGGRGRTVEARAIAWLGGGVGQGPGSRCTRATAPRGRASFAPDVGPGAGVSELVPKPALVGPTYALVCMSLTGVRGGGRSALAEFVHVPLADTTLAGLPNGCSPDAARLIDDCLAAGWVATECGGAQPNDKVAIVGNGAVAQLAALSAQAVGADVVAVVEPLLTRRLKPSSQSYVRRSFKRIVPRLSSPACRPVGAVTTPSASALSL